MIPANWTAFRIALLVCLFVGVGVMVPGPASAQDDDGRPLPEPVESRALPDGREAKPLPEDGAAARELPDRERDQARDVPDGLEAGSTPDGVEGRPGPVDPRPAKVAPAAGDLLPEPLDRPIPPDAGSDRAFWEARRERAESNLERIRAELGRTEEAFTEACRFAGGDRCDALHARADVLRRQRAALEDYLDGGLRRDCRRAGCEPGWIRD